MLTVVWLAKTISDPNWPITIAKANVDFALFATLPPSLLSLDALIARTELMLVSIPATRARNFAPPAHPNVAWSRLAITNFPK